jgi:hypothetical protein
MTDSYFVGIDDLVRWLEMKKPDSIGKCSPDDVFDLGQQIADDIKNHNFRNGFVIYDNGGKIRIISIFTDKNKKAPMSKQLLTELSKYILEINK